MTDGFKCLRRGARWLFCSDVGLEWVGFDRVVPSIEDLKETKWLPTELLCKLIPLNNVSGAGQQTLGEEYCDLSQVADSYELPPTPARRVCIIIYQSVQQAFDLRHPPALIPLHKPKPVSVYDQQLPYCITQFVYKDHKLADTVVSGLNVRACDVINPVHIEAEFDSIGGLENIKTSLFELVILPLRRPKLFAHGKLLSPQKGVLLYGPPGTVKTMLAKALAKESGVVFINVRVSNLMSKWFGDARKLVAAVISLAYKLQPAIIFIDEVDSFLGQHRNTDH
ncbi:hypothetical protein M5K25_014564 [Dendrobium thyrsiflorum]|uniref:ATPase AAA-type core domain-containing protein n=1 Tax=Dendrobium thyrsiflorum TaxID=117978 RepID=A0ABD0UN23_DENTH